jgi:SHS2 domain-containing protein
VPAAPVGAAALPAQLAEAAPEGALPQRANRRGLKRAVEPADSAASGGGATSVAGATLAGGGYEPGGYEPAPYEPAAEPPPEPAAEIEAAADGGPGPEWRRADAPVQYAYLDHTADVQLHSWGASLEVAFEQQVLAMMDLITELPTVDADGPEAREVVVEAEGHDLHSLLYNFLDEWLYQFNAELFVCKRVKVLALDRARWAIRSAGVGERFVLGRHPQGTEIKAVTYSAMRVTEEEDRTDVLVIVDI